MSWWEKAFGHEHSVSLVCYCVSSVKCIKTTIWSSGPVIRKVRLSRAKLVVQQSSQMSLLGQGSRFDCDCSMAIEQDGPRDVPKQSSQLVRVSLETSLVVWLVADGLPRLTWTMTSGCFSVDWSLSLSETQRSFCSSKEMLDKYFFHFCQIVKNGGEMVRSRIWLKYQMLIARHTDHSGCPLRWTADPHPAGACKTAVASRWLVNQTRDLLKYVALCRKTRRDQTPRTSKIDCFAVWSFLTTQCVLQARKQKTVHTFITCAARRSSLSCCSVKNFLSAERMKEQPPFQCVLCRYIHEVNQEWEVNVGQTAGLLQPWWIACSAVSTFKVRYGKPETDKGVFFLSMMDSHLEV